MRLPDPGRSRAILIGTSTYRSPALADLPAVRNNLADLAATLTDPTLGAMTPDRCTVVAEPGDPRSVYRVLRGIGDSTEDTLLVYFAGHGRTGARNELYLGLADTDPDELRVSALPYDLLRDVLLESPAVNRVVILDCCFSGRAVQDMAGADETILGQVGIEGTYVLTATSANAVALAPLGARYTAFTGVLLDLIRAGVPGGPALLTFGTIYRHLLQATATRGIPAPRQRGTGTVDQLALIRNAAATSGSPAAMAAVPAAALLSPDRKRAPAHRAHRQPEPSTPRTAVVLRKTAGWLCFAAALVYGLGQLIVRTVAMALSADSLRRHFEDSGASDVIFGVLYLFGQPIITAVVCVVAFWLIRRPDARAFAGVGLALGFGAYVAAWLPVRLQGSGMPLQLGTIWLFGRPLDSWATALGSLLLSAAAASAVGVCLRQRSSVRLGRPAHLARAIGLGASGLVSAVAYLWPLSGLFGLSIDTLTGVAGTALIALLVPLAHAMLRPAQLAGGLLAGWLATALEATLNVFSVQPPTKWAETDTAGWLTTVTFIAASILILVLAVRNRSESAYRPTAH